MKTFIVTTFTPRHVGESALVVILEPSGNVSQRTIRPSEIPALREDGYAVELIRRAYPGFKNKIQGDDLIYTSINVDSNKGLLDVWRVDCDDLNPL